MGVGTLEAADLATSQGDPEQYGVTAYAATRYLRRSIMYLGNIDGRGRIGNSSADETRGISVAIDGITIGRGEEGKISGLRRWLLAGAKPGD